MENPVINETSDPEGTPKFPVLRTCPFGVPDTYREMENKERVSKVAMSDGRPAWLILRNEDARFVLSDSRFSSDKLRPGFPELSPGGLKALTYFAPFLVNMDGPEHSRARRAVLAEFSARKIATLEPRIQRIVDDRVDAILASPDKPVDLVGELSFPVPTLVLEALVGVAAADMEEVERKTEKMLVGATTEDEQHDAAEELQAHLAGIIAAKEADPGDDLLSRQIERSRRENGGEVDRRELASLLQLLQVAGHASSAVMIAMSVFTMLSNPAELDRITADPTRTPAAVEELLRYLSITDFGPLRLALEDVEVGGVTIRAGDGVVIPTIPANRDVRTFPDPDTFDVSRAPSTRHVAFGYGAHQCLGQNVVRAELRIVLDTLFARIPGIRLAASEEEMSFKYHSLFFGPTVLPVTW